MNLPVTPIVWPSDLVGVPNGAVPPHLLTPCGLGGLEMHHLASRAMIAMAAAIRAELGITLWATSTMRTISRQTAAFDGTDEVLWSDRHSGRYIPEHLWSAYESTGRTWAVERDGSNDVRSWNGTGWKRRGGTAASAVPATSNHGTAIAADLAELSNGKVRSVSPQLVAWLVEHVHRYGFSFEDQAEPWHVRLVCGDDLPPVVLAYEAELVSTPPQPRRVPRPSMLRLVVRCYMVVVLLGAVPAVVWGFGRSMALGALLLVLLGAQWAAVVVVITLRWVDPRSTAFMRRVASAQREFTWVPDAAISPELRLAAVAGEDIYFALHSGFDWESLRAARAHNKQAGARMRGGSTISQQVAKNLFLWPGRSYVRKALETWFTLLIEAAWSKRRILEVYLNVAQFGPHTFGAEAAARRFFGTPAAVLARGEAALLVAALPNPAERHVDDPERTLRYRQLLIIGSMRKLERSGFG